MEEIPEIFQLPALDRGKWTAQQEMERAQQATLVEGGRYVRDIPVGGQHESLYVEVWTHPSTGSSIAASAGRLGNRESTTSAHA